MIKKRLITSALPYVNNIPHLGNIIGCVLSADVFARYSRLAGYQTLFISGTDEYGTTTETKAKEEKLTPREICDKYNSIHNKIYQWFNIQFDHFGRTTCKEHIEIVQSIFLKLHKNGFIVEEIVNQPFCEHDKMFLADRFVEGTCPVCGYDKAKGDQCDSCGKLLDPSDLKTPKCSICGKSPVFRDSKHLFLDLVKLKPQLEQWISESSTENNWSNNALTVTKGWLEVGLKKRCITRDLNWGIPVPLKGYENKVFYVWFDAPIGYISITAEHTSDWKNWWQSPEDTELYQFMGKDNIPFHTVIFPASLIGTADKWTMLKNISSTEYLNYENTKFSKSRGTGVFGDQAVSSGISPDLFRYYLLRNRPEKNDTNFYWNDFMEKVNGEIIANYANLTNRILQFITRFFDSKIPPVTCPDFSVFNKVDMNKRLSEYSEIMENIEIKRGLLSVLDISSEANKFFQDMEPWKLIKENPDKAGSVIGSLAAMLKDITILLSPYLPETAEKVFKMLNHPSEKNKLSDIGDYTGFNNRVIGETVILFNKIEKDLADNLTEQFRGDDKPDIIDLFSKLNLRTGNIISVEKHPEADKLYIEKIDMGNGEIRQVISGLVKYYKENELIGKKVIVVSNLKTAKLRGVESQGMILAAETAGKQTVEVLESSGNPGDAVTIEGCDPSNQEITIEEFAKVPLTVNNNIVNAGSFPLKSSGREITTKIVNNGKVG